MPVSYSFYLGLSGSDASTISGRLSVLTRHPVYGQTEQTNGTEKL